ncbi:MAG: PspC domain-containing protein [Pseudomonadales bacterium]
MSGSDRRYSKERRAAREARRAERLAQREKLRAERKAQDARKAALRASALAEEASRSASTSTKASRSTHRGRERSIEDYVDDFTQKWEKKAEAWFEEQGRSMFGADTDDVHATADETYGTGKTGEKRMESSRSRSRRSRRYSTKPRGHRSFRSRFNSGRGLYRDKRRGKICGVCAGVAEYLEVDTWQVRLVAVLGLIFVPSVAITVYFITYFLMDDKPYYRRVTDRYKDADATDVYDDVYDDGYDDAGDSRGGPRLGNAEALRTAKDKFSDIEVRLRNMESHVTSSKFELQRELRKIAGEDA